MLAKWICPGVQTRQPATRILRALEASIPFVLEFGETTRANVKVVYLPCDRERGGERRSGIGTLKSRIEEKDGRNKSVVLAKS